MKENQSSDPRIQCKEFSSLSQGGPKSILFMTVNEEGIATKLHGNNWVSRFLT